MAQTHRPSLAVGDLLPPRSIVANNFAAESENRIHTASKVQYFALPRQGDGLSLRGKVADTYTKRGHELVELDLAMFDAAERPLAYVRHTAIIRLESPGQRHLP